MPQTDTPPTVDGLWGDDRDWMPDALCAQVDGDLFYPEDSSSAAPAKQICQLCPVRGACLEYAIRHNERSGVWGGLSERQRRKLERARRQQVDAA